MNNTKNNTLETIFSHAQANEIIFDDQSFTDSVMTKITSSEDNNFLFYISEFSSKWKSLLKVDSTELIGATFGVCAYLMFVDPSQLITTASSLIPNKVSISPINLMMISVSVSACALTSWLILDENARN